jgi:hypothetical protein
MTNEAYAVVNQRQLRGWPRLTIWKFMERGWLTPVWADYFSIHSQTDFTHWTQASTKGWAVYISSLRSPKQCMCDTECLQWFVYRKSSARYSGHINSRLMRGWAQPDQTGHNSYYMRGKQKEHSGSACWKTCSGLVESLLVPLIIHIEVERTTECYQARRLCQVIPQLWDGWLVLDRVIDAPV